MKSTSPVPETERKSLSDARALSPLARRHEQLSLPPVVADALRSTGQPLDPAARAFLEPRFGHDFSRVRVHTDGLAAEAAQAVNALAFTAGQDVVFAQGQYAPETEGGLRLIAHELTHVVQQRGTPLVGIRRRVRRPDTVPPPAGAEPGRELPAVVYEDVDLSALARAETPAAAPPGEEAPAPAAVAAARADAAGGACADLVIAPNHPSELEADRVSNWLVSRNAGSGRPTINSYSVGRALARDDGPARPEAEGAPRRRLDIVFIMGRDRPRSGNPFYAMARRYFQFTMPTATLVDDDAWRNLAAVFDYLRRYDPTREAVGNLYLVSHANEQGYLSFPLTASDEDVALGHVDFAQLRSAVATRPGLFTLPRGLVDRESVIHIKGCNIGRSTAMLNELDRAFGGRGRVTAPTHRQTYHAEWDRRTGATTSASERFQTYYLEYPGRVEIPVAQQRTDFAARYTFLSAERWNRLLGRSGATRAVQTPLSFRWTGPADSDARAIADARAWGDPQLARPEMHLWRIAARTRQPDGRIEYRVEANKTNYTVDRTLADEAGLPVAADETNPLLFGTSDVEAPVPAPIVTVTPGTMTEAQLFQRIAQVRRDINALPRDDEDRRRDLTADWEALEADLHTRPGRLAPHQLVAVIGGLAQSIGRLAGDVTTIRDDLVLAGRLFGTELSRRPAGLAGPDVVRLLTAVSGEETRVADGDAEIRGLLTAAQVAGEAELRRRNLRVHVRVVKTEDWLGADEVYLQLAGGRHTEQTTEVKLNDGQDYTWEFPAGPFMPLAGPLGLQVFDADWPDRDDLIVRMEWRPPFAPQENTESFDEADYRVRVYFDR